MRLGMTARKDMLDCGLTEVPCRVPLTGNTNLFKGEESNKEGS